MRPPTVCGTPGCPQLVSAGSGGRCQQHRRPAWQGSTGMGMSGGAWATIRRRIHQRDRGRCTRCGIPVGQRYEIDHVVRRADGGSNTPDNLRTLCLPCHAAITAQQRRGVGDHPPPPAS